MEFQDYINILGETFVEVQNIVWFFQNYELRDVCEVTKKLDTLASIFLVLSSNNLKTIRSISNNQIILENSITASIRDINAFSVNLIVSFRCHFFTLLYRAIEQLTKFPRAIEDVDIEIRIITKIIFILRNASAHGDSGKLNIRKEGKRYTPKHILSLIQLKDIQGFIINEIDSENEISFEYTPKIFSSIIEELLPELQKLHELYPADSYNFAIQ